MKSWSIDEQVTSRVVCNLLVRVNSVQIINGVRDVTPADLAAFYAAQDPEDQAKIKGAILSDSTLPPFWASIGSTFMGPESRRVAWTIYESRQGDKFVSLEAATSWETEAELMRFARDNARRDRDMERAGFVGTLQAGWSYSWQGDTVYWSKGYDHCSRPSTELERQQRDALKQAEERIAALSRLIGSQEHSGPDIHLTDDQHLFAGGIYVHQDRVREIERRCREAEEGRASWIARHASILAEANALREQLKVVMSRAVDAERRLKEMRAQVIAPQPAEALCETVYGERRGTELCQSCALELCPIRVAAKRP